MEVRDNDLFRARKTGLSLLVLAFLGAAVLNSLSLLGILAGERTEGIRSLLTLALPWLGPALLLIQLPFHPRLGSGSHNMPWAARAGELLLGLALLGLFWFLRRFGPDFSGAGDWLHEGVFAPLLLSAGSISLYEGIMLIQNCLCDLLLKG